MSSEPDIVEAMEPAIMLEHQQSPSHSLTLPRMLDGRQYDAQKIDDCFAL
jgi:hypothetical protein